MNAFRAAALSGTALALVLFAGSAGTAFAQSLTSDYSSTYLSPMVVSTGRGFGGNRDPYAVPGAVSTIGADDIATFGGKNLDDVLRTTPGTFTRDNVQNPGIAVNIRGLEGSGRVNMMIDGVKQSFRVTGHDAQGFTYVDPAFIQGIDIQRGAVTGVGGGALAGTANFKTIGVDDLLQGKDYGGFVTGTLGDNNSGGSGATAAAFRVNDTFAILAGVSARKSWDYNNGNGQRVLYTAQQNQTGIVKVEITPDAYNSLTLSGNFYTAEFLAASYNQTINNRTLVANYAYSPDDNELVDLRLNAYLNNTSMIYRGNASGAGLFKGREIEDAGGGFDVSNTSEWDFGEVHLTSNYGLEYFRDDVVSKESATQTGDAVNPSGQSSTLGIFTSNKFTYDIYELTVGARYDHFTIDGKGVARADNPVLPAGPYEVHRSEGTFNPKVTLAVNPTDWIQPYITYAESSRAPTINETMAGGSNPSGFTIAQANPFLKPEKSRGIEVGANLRFDAIFTDSDSLRIKANYFYNNIEDYIAGRRVDLSGVAHPGFAFYNLPGTSILQGLELQAAYDAGFVFASAAYTYTNSQLPAQQNGAGAQSYLPAHVFSATLGTRLLEQQNLTLGGRFYAVSESYIGDINVTPPASPYEPGYNLVDLFANYEFENAFELGATVSNLFNTVYTPVLSTPGSNPATTPTGRGRTFQVTAKATF